MECSFLSSHSIFLMYPYRNTLEIRPISGKGGTQSPLSPGLGEEILPWPETQNASPLLFLLLWKGLKSRKPISFPSLDPDLPKSICTNGIEAGEPLRTDFQDRTYLRWLFGISTGLALHLGGNSVIRTHCIFIVGVFFIPEVTELGASGK